jgi:hypothetical protein
MSLSLKHSVAFLLQRERLLQGFEFVLQTSDFLLLERIELSLLISLLDGRLLDLRLDLHLLVD